MNGWLFLIPIISAIAGWLFQSLIVSMLFRPQKPIHILGFTFQGFIPKRKIFIAEKLGEAAADFISFDEIEKKVSNPDNFRKILPTIEEHIEHFLRVKLKESMPMIGMLIGDRTINQLKQVFIVELEELFPQVMLQYTGSLIEEFNIREIVKQKVNNISDHSFKTLVYQNIGGELQKLKVYAALFGFIIGLLHLGIIYLTL